LKLRRETFSAKFTLYIDYLKLLVKKEIPLTLDFKGEQAKIDLDLLAGIEEYCEKLRNKLNKYKNKNLPDKENEYQFNKEEFMVGLEKIYVDVDEILLSLKSAFPEQLEKPIYSKAIVETMNRENDERGVNELLICIEEKIYKYFFEPSINIYHDYNVKSLEDVNKFEIATTLLSSLIMYREKLENVNLWVLC
jgi:ribosome-associated translation inhibitor RaiA